MKRISKLFIARLLAYIILGCLTLSVNAADVEYDFGEFIYGSRVSNRFPISTPLNPGTINIYFRASKDMQIRYFIEPTEEYTCTCEFRVFERHGGEREFITRKLLLDDGSFFCMHSYLPEGEYRIAISSYPKTTSIENYKVLVALAAEYIPTGEKPDTPIGFTNISEPTGEDEPTYTKVTTTGLTSTRSYIRKTTPLSTDGLSALETISYFDGLGRPVQTIQKGFTPSKADLVDFTDYNNRGNVWRNWNPIPISGLNGAFVSDQPVRAKALLNDTRPYAETTYDRYGMDIPVRQAAPGEEFSEHPTFSEMHVNKTSGIYACNCYNIQTGQLIANGVYPEGTLSITETTDEDGRKSIIFKDRMKRIIAEKQFDGETDNSTYYVYSPGGDLAYVLPPALEGGTDSTALYKYAYTYKYDGLHRMTEKKLPGCEPIHYYYDMADRVAFTQDGNQFAKGDYSFILYNLQGQIAVTGLCKCNNPKIFETSLAYAVQLKYDGYCNSGYTFPLMHSATDIRLSQVNYYDTYSYLDIPCISKYKTALSYLYKEEYGSRFVNSQCDTVSSYGRLTGSRTFIIDNSDEIIVSYYYDDRGNVVQSSTKNHLGRCEHDYMAYTFSNQIKTHKHTFGLNENTFEVNSYFYDHASRLIRLSHSLGNNSPVILYENEYDEFGKLKTRTTGTKANCTKYSYNLRNWLTATTNPFFSQTLHYTNGVGTPQYGGNISSMAWKTGETVCGYKFMYDGFNRMTKSIYGEDSLLSINQNRFNEEISGYDKNGNILGLKRTGQIGENNYGLVDNLFFTYNGNQLQAVNDSSVNSAYNNGFEFNDGAKQNTEYYNDANGNLTKDLNKKITDIQYNYLNLPCRIQFEDGSVISYLYDAAGTKLRTTHVIDNKTTTTDYYRNLIFENGAPAKILTEVGYISLPKEDYHFFIQDHQGNNRILINRNGKVEETNQYYPFGGNYTNFVSVQPYKFNGKELDTKKELNWYDYGARQYDAVLGRWIVMDPMSEKYYPTSPYTYCHNSPTNRIDIIGEWDVTIHVYNNRDSFGYGFLSVSDKSGNSVFSTTVRVEGSNSKENGYNKRDRTRTNADTPTGQYNIKGWSKRLPNANRGAYGPNDVLELDYMSGEAAGLRNGMHLHGGRQEGKGGKGKGSTLKVTQGCIRIYDEDIAKMKRITDQLEENDSEEKGNSLNIIDDLKRIDNGPYPRPFDYQRGKNNQNVWDIFYRILQSNPNIKVYVYH